MWWPWRVIDIKTRRPVLANTTGGLSGPAIKPVALRMVWQVAQAVKVPLIGIGGIMSATDVVEFLLAGATAVQVGTASVVTPGIAQTIAEDLEPWMQANGVHDVRELIGGAQRV
jgi:dihydroorotate dehydrogenase (NAD+) catalytic subunit